MLDITRLFSFMSENHVTQSNLSKATGISTGNISDWKKGKSFPSAEKLVLIAEYLDCSTDFLLGLSDQPQRQDRTLSTNEATIFKLFRLLNDTQQGILIGRAELMVEENDNRYEQEGAG